MEAKLRAAALGDLITKPFFFHLLSLKLGLLLLFLYPSAVAGNQVDKLLKF